MKSKLSKLAVSVAAVFSMSAMSIAVDAINNQAQANDGDSTVAPWALEDRYIIRFKKGADAERISRRLENEGFKAAHVLRRKRMMAMRLNKAKLDELRASSEVESIEIDPPRKLLAQTQPYGIGMVQADQIVQSDLSARKVCVIDTGFSLGHEDLADENSGVTGVANNNRVGDWFFDGHGHGTHVAGTVAALDNDLGVIGVYPGVSLHIVKIFDNNGQWTFASDLIAGIQQCQDGGADVVNMSLGGSGSSTTEEQAMQAFVDEGMMLVAAAGNDANSAFSFPASYDAVVSVAAVESDEGHAWYSQTNSQVEIAGPGTSVLSTIPVNAYTEASGTSMATPHVAGVAALVWSFNDTCTNEEIRAALNATAKDKGAAGRDVEYGFGIVQASDALDYLATNGCEGGNNGGGDDPVSETFTDIDLASRQWWHMNVDIPEGVTSLSFVLSGGTGNADLFVNYGERVLFRRWDCRPRIRGNEEVCTFENPAAGTWFFSVFGGRTGATDTTLTYTYE